MSFPAITLEPTYSNYDSGAIVRPLLPLGRYPSAVFARPEAVYAIGPDIAYLAIEIAGGLPPSERPWASPEEVRLISALTFSVPPGEGAVAPYLSSRAFHLHGTFESLSSPTIATALIRALSDADEEAWAEPPLPFAGGSAYETNTRADLEGRTAKAFDAIDCSDALLIRGLGALTKAAMLSQHYCFHTEACMSLHVAMEASGELIRRHLRNTGRADSYHDAGRYLSELFDEPPTGERYFAAYYDDRIKATHPNSRFGALADAPMAADDFYDLHESLLEVYFGLLTLPPR
jgi:hypothetical protein